MRTKISPAQAPAQPLGVPKPDKALSNHLWNALGMVLAGLAFMLAGGCPGRQLILSGEGDGDAALFVLGMIAGAAFAHNFALAAGLDTIVTPNSYTAHHDFKGALRVVPDLGQVHVARLQEWRRQ